MCILDSRGSGLSTYAFGTCHHIHRFNKGVDVHLSYNLCVSRKAEGLAFLLPAFETCHLDHRYNKSVDVCVSQYDLCVSRNFLHLKPVTFAIGTINKGVDVHLSYDLCVSRKAEGLAFLLPAFETCHVDHKYNTGSVRCGCMCVAI